MHRLPKTLLILLASLVLGSGSAIGQSATPLASPTAVSYAHPEWLVDSAWLAERTADPTVAIIALMPPEDFAAGHIPGSVQTDWPAFEITETSDQQIESWRNDVEAIFTSLGVTRDQTVVVYDGGTFYAPRLWWLFYQLGHEDIRILNGGLPAWSSSGQAVETGPVEPTPAATPYVGIPNDEAIAEVTEVETAVADDGTTLIDARESGEYADGHIPGAINIPFTQNAEADGPKYWKSAEELLAMYAAAGVTPDQTVIPYCTTGVRSAATYFTLRLIGFEKVSLFSGSYAEWTSDPDRPVTTGDQP